MTTDQRAFLVRSLKRVSLAIVLGGLAIAVFAPIYVSAPANIDTVRASAFFYGPVLLLGAVVWWIARFIQVG